MDRSLDRDYKVFDVNITMRQLKEEEKQLCSECEKIKRGLCEKCTVKYKSKIKSFVDYSKSKGPNRMDYRCKNDIEFLGEEDIKKAEKIIKLRTDHSFIPESK